MQPSMMEQSVVKGKVVAYVFKVKYFYNPGTVNTAAKVRQPVPIACVTHQGSASD